MPRCIGVVTSKTGAAWQDVQNVIGRRWPMVKLLLAPVNVQGIEAEKSITEGIRRLDRDPRPDLILVTRGGGSKEDLWVFNSERIARAAAACRKPVVSAVGHEIDTSILDYVADLRAPTPLCCSGDLRARPGGCAAENIHFTAKYSKIYRIVAIYAIIGLISWPLPRFLQRRHSQLTHRERELSRAAGVLSSAAQRRVQSAERQLQNAAAVAESLSPYAVLARGYTLTERQGALRGEGTAPRRDDHGARCKGRRRMPRGSGA